MFWNLFYKDRTENDELCIITTGRSCEEGNEPACSIKYREFLDSIIH